MAESGKLPAYVHGHSPAVLSAHGRRTVKGFTPYVIPYVKPDFSVLDVGCGPGSISADLATMVPVGRVTCFDASEVAVETARALFEARDLRNGDFVAGDVAKLPFPDGSFDLVHAHQVVIHLEDPDAAMREMKRVLKTGGILACKDMILSSTAYYPALPCMDAWVKALVSTMRVASCDPDMGARLKGLALDAGFEAGNVKCSVGSWCFSEPEDVEWWGTSVADRMAEESELRKRVEKVGSLTDLEMDAGVKAWREWATSKDAWFGVMNGEIICQK
ncbi:related to ubiE/COQ5 methyltransferase [Cephalotrichum gorgonifer]|uniref:Related to ubiE/COQ5 methyltransferase n=1 Tax=Cephalotrichum gorgonifer TaxID=2041049 RepID=A0AAE8MZ04_9PEZI|nr:related to ubiE/COQ5 methyltransferase [Cephalotrichum gorgonifer]